MFLETVESEGLAHLSYLIGDEGAGVGVVVDPRRDVDVYHDLARRREVRIIGALETHIHADFVSGSRELAARTGAPIYVGEAADYAFEHHGLHDGEALEVGGLTLRVLHTPGHTPEHVCYLVSGGRGAGAPWGLFSGDTLFAGEVGRPDLLGSEVAGSMARDLFRSLREKMLAVGDEVEVYPAHGAGSPCGARIGDRRTTTIGYERRHNPRLRVDDADEFVRRILETAPPAPTYYPRMKTLNAAGPRVVGGPPEITPVPPDAFREEMDRPDRIVIDTREIEAFGGGHIEGALNIALREPFPIWVGWLIAPELRILIVAADPRDLETAARHFFRIGYEKLDGYLLGGMARWFEAGLRFRRTEQLGVHDLQRWIESDVAGLQLLDVRSDDEWRTGHIPNARHRPLYALAGNLDDLDRTVPVATYCSTGFRASIAASLLERNGFERVYNVPGSMKAWRAAGYEIEDEAGGRGERRDAVA